MAIKPEHPHLPAAVFLDEDDHARAMHAAIQPGEDRVHSLRKYWVTVKRHLWLILLSTLAALLFAFFYSVTRVPLYTAEATVLIERKAAQNLKVQDPRSDSLANDSNKEFYKTQYEILQSSALAERVIRQEALQNHTLFRDREDGAIEGFVNSAMGWAKGYLPASPATSGPAVVTSPTMGLTGVYLAKLEVRPVAGTSLVKVIFTTPDPALSARLANAHVDSYLRYGVDLRIQTNQDAPEFLKQRLTQLKERVEQSENALTSYRKDISVDEKENVIIDRWLELNKNLNKAEAERIGLEAQIRSIRGRGFDEIPAVRENAVISGLKDERAKLEAEFASLSKEFKPGYPPLDSLKSRIDENRRRLQSETQSEVRKIEAAYNAAKNDEAALRGTLERQKLSTFNLKESAVKYAMLARDVETNKHLYDGVLQRLKDIGVAAEARNSNIYLMGRAEPPLDPSYPDSRGMLMRGLLLGLLAGVGLAFLLDRLDNTIKSSEEAERFLRLPTLGVVPDFALMKGPRVGYMSRLINSAKGELPGRPSQDEDRSSVLDHHPQSPFAEAYRSLRSSLLLSQAGGPPHIMLMTSATRGEGKTTTLVNTAILFAQLGIPVLVIDADLRRPRCHMLLKMKNSAGLADLLTGHIDIDGAIRSAPVENLFLISGGAVPPNPAELLGSKRMHELLKQLRTRFEFILIDSSPVMAVSDAVFLPTMVDGTLLVVNRRTPKPLVRKTRDRLNMPHTKLLGVLLNRVDVRAGEYGGYYSHDYEYYPHGAKLPSSAHSAGGSGNEAIAAGRNGRSPRAPKPVPPDKHGNGLAGAFFDAPGPKLATAASAPIMPMGPVALTEQITSLDEPHYLPKPRREELTGGESQEIAHYELGQSVKDEVLGDRNIHPEDGALYAGGAPAAASAHAENTNELGLSAPVEANQEAANPAVTTSPEFMNVVGDHLLRAIGPMAPIVLREYVRALGGISGSVPKAKLKELAMELGREISSDQHRQRFEKEISLEIEKLAAPADSGLSDLPKTDENRAVKPVATKEERERAEFLLIISVKLTDAIGIMAPLVLRESIAALGEAAQTFNQARFGELISEVSKEIANESTRWQFQAETVREFQKLKGQKPNSREPEVSKAEGKDKGKFGIKSWGRTAKS